MYVYIRLDVFENSSFLSRFQAVNMVKRVCRDYPIPECGAKYLVKLSNHLTDVHQLDYIQRRMWLQEAKLQPKLKIIIYQEGNNKNCSTRSPHKTTLLNQQEEKEIMYQQSAPRKAKGPFKSQTGGVRKATKKSKPLKKTTHWHTL